MSEYEVGKQPCQNLRRAPGNIAAAPELPNVHQCYQCGGRVTFCENCYRDHHENGYETCVAEQNLVKLSDILEVIDGPEFYDILPGDGEDDYIVGFLTRLLKDRFQERGKRRASEHS